MGIEINTVGEWRTQLGGMGTLRSKTKTNQDASDNLLDRQTDKVDYKSACQSLKIQPIKTLLIYKATHPDAFLYEGVVFESTARIW